MKNINKFLAAGITLFAVILICISCGDDHDFNKYDSPVDPNSAKLKYIHTAVGPNGVNFTTNFSIANQKISAVNIIAGLPLGIGFGNTYPIPLNYALVPSGSQSMNVVNTCFAGQCVHQISKFWGNSLFNFRFY